MGDLRGWLIFPRRRERIMFGPREPYARDRARRTVDLKA
jgi:hypothetical protein